MESEVTIGDTRERLLDTAEVLFAQKGLEVSLREITSTAGANVAAVNYHFGSRDGLINAVMARHAKPINDERIRILGELLARSETPTVREVVEAFLRPLAERITSQAHRQRLFAQFMGRMTALGLKGLPEEMIAQFCSMAALLVRALQRALPKMSDEEAFCRLKFCIAVLADSMIKDEAFDHISGDRLANWNWERKFEEVLEFCVGGLQR